MEAGSLAIVAATGLFAGTVNTVAGGGSLVTLPVLLLLGMPADAANATNRVGVVAQSLTAARSFEGKDLLDRKDALPLLGWTSIGSVCGAFVSLELDELLFERIIAVLLLLLLGTVLVNPRRLLEGRVGPPPSHHAWSSPLTFLGIGFYGGFLQAGVGFFTLAALVLLEGRDLIRANALKTLLVGGLTVPALAVFVVTGRVEWIPGLVLAAGSAAGGWLGARLTVGWGPPLVRWATAAMVLFSATRLLGIW